MFSRYLSAGRLALLCRAIRHSLDAGIVPTKIFAQQAERGDVFRIFRRRASLRR